MHWKDYSMAMKSVPNNYVDFHELEMTDISTQLCSLHIYCENTMLQF